MKGQNRIKRGSGFRGVLSYVLDHDSPEHIGGTLPFGNLHQMTREFIVLAATRNDIEKPVWHNSLRLPAGEHITNKLWRDIATDYMHQLGFDDSAQWIAFKHNKEDGEHIHIIANRVLPTGFIYLGQNENLKSTKIISELERKYRLTVTKTAEIDDDNKIIIREKSAMKKNELDKMKRTGHISERVRLQNHIDEAIKDGPTVTEFVESLNKVGVIATPNIANTGRMNGFSFSISDGELSFSGSKLGRKYTWSNLLEAGLKYDAERDAAFLASQKHKKSASRNIKEDLITARLSSKIVKATDAEKLRLMTQIEHDYEQQGDQFFCKNSEQLAFTEEDNRIVCHLVTPEAIAALTKLAKIKFGNEFVSTGSEEFRRESWVQAALLGCLDHGYKPTFDDISELKRRLSDLESKPQLHEKIAILLKDEEGTGAQSELTEESQRQLDKIKLAVSEKELELQTLFERRKVIAEQANTITDKDRSEIKKRAYQSAMPASSREELAVIAHKVREIKNKLSDTNNLFKQFQLNRELNNTQSDLTTSEQAINTPDFLIKQESELARLTAEANQHYHNMKTRKQLEIKRIDEQSTVLINELESLEKERTELAVRLSSMNETSNLAKPII